MPEIYVNLSWWLIYGLYLVGAVFAARLAWRRTADVLPKRRVIIRSLIVAILFAPTMFGLRIVPFLPAVVALLILDLVFVRPLSSDWLVATVGLFATNMLFPMICTWAIIALCWYVFGRCVPKRKSIKERGHEQESG